MHASRAAAVDSAHISCVSAVLLLFTESAVRVSEQPPFQHFECDIRILILVECFSGRLFPQWSDEQSEAVQ